MRDPDRNLITINTDIVYNIKLLNSALRNKKNIHNIINYKFMN